MLGRKIGHEPGGPWQTWTNSGSACASPKEMGAAKDGDECHKMEKLNVKNIV